MGEGRPCILLQARVTRDVWTAHALGPVRIMLSYALAWASADKSAC